MSILRDEDQLVSNVTELDFLKIRDGLKNFLRSQERFKDYDFEGSNISVLLDLLAYNTHYNALYLNLFASEIFLDTAIRRDSAVNKAKQLGYVPRSRRASSAIVDLTITPNAGFENLPVIIIPAKFQFSADVLGEKYTFSTLDAYEAFPDGNGSFVAEQVEIVEGRLFTVEETATLARQEFPLPNIDVDTSRITVQVAANGSSQKFTYNLPENITNATSESRIYFIREADGLRHVISFGDDVIGRSIVPGNVVTIEYLVSEADAPNGAAVFSVDGEIPEAEEIEISLVRVSATGGAQIESIQSIKSQAPLLYQAQNRTVTTVDYVSILKREYANFESVIAWGGEDNVPRALGYVFLSVKPFGRLFLTDTEKKDIEDFLQESYCPVTIIPVVVDPRFIFVKVNTLVKFDPNVITSSVVALQDSVFNTIKKFGSENLDRFGEYLRYSRLVNNIDKTDISITNSLTEIRLERSENIGTVLPTSYAIEFYNSIEPGTLRTNNFSFTSRAPNPIVTYPNAFIADDRDGNVGLVFVDSNNDRIQIPGYEIIGSVDYVTGRIEVIDLLIDAPVVGQTVVPIGFEMTPDSMDVFPVRNNILTIPDAFITVNAVADSNEL